MKNMMKKAAVSMACLLTVGVVHAHPGSHGSDGIFAGVAHLLGEHGYLLVLLLGIGAIVMRRSGRVRPEIDESAAPTEEI